MSFEIVDLLMNNNVPIEIEFTISSNYVTGGHANIIHALSYAHKGITSNKYICTSNSLGEIHDLSLAVAAIDDDVAPLQMW